MLIFSLRAFFSSNSAHASEDGRMILFGPYAPLSAGEYKIVFSLKIDKQVDEPVVKIDVVANKALKVFASKEIKGTDFKMSDKYQNFDLYFDTTGEKDFEFRVRLLRDSNISVDRVGVTQLKKWPVEQIVGGNMLKGSGKVDIITDEESLLGSSKFVELKTDDLRFKRNAGWSDPTQVDQTTKPVLPSNKASLPKTTTGLVLLLIIVFIISCAFILTGIFVLKGDVGQNDKSVNPKVRGQRNLTDSSLRQEEYSYSGRSRMNKKTSSKMLERKQHYRTEITPPEPASSNKIKFSIRTQTYAEQDSSVASLPQNDRSEATRNDKKENFQIKYSSSAQSQSSSTADSLTVKRLDVKEVILKLTELGKSRIAVFLQEALNIAKNLSTRHFVILGLLNTIIVFVFFENTFFLSSSNVIGYLLVLYIVLSLTWKINSRVSVAAALLLLMSCPFFLISAQEQLAENVAVYVYYFLVIGVFLQLKEYALEEKIPVRETENSGSPGSEFPINPRLLEDMVEVTKTGSSLMEGEAVPKTYFEQSEGTRSDRKEVFLEQKEGLLGQPIADLSSGARYRVEELRRRKRKVKRHRLIILIVLLSVSLLATGMFLWMRLSGKSEKKNKSVSQLPVKVNNSRLSKEREELSVNKGEIKIEVLNGNGIKGKALTIENLLKSNGFNVLSTGNADNFNYTQTVIRYKKGKKEIADLAAEVISSVYFPVLQEDVTDDSKADIVIVLGQK